MHKLRVLHIVSVPNVGGAQTYVETVIQHLTPLGYRCAVVCNDEPELVSRYARIAEVFPMVIPYNKVSPWGDLRFFAHLLHLLRRERFDIVQTSAAKASLYGRLAARLTRVPGVIFTAHGFPFHEFMHPLLRQALISLEKFLSRRCTDVVVSVSEEDRRYALTAGIVPAEQITTIQNGIDLSAAIPDTRAARQALELDIHTPVIGMVGRLSQQKAPQDFLRVAALINREFPRATFLLVGDGPLRSDLEQQAATLGIAKQVRFLGFRKDVPQVMAALDVFVLSSYWEGMPLTILEAMAAAKPVVATAVNGVVEVVQHGCTGFLAPPQEVGQLAAHVLALLRDPGHAQAMGKAGRRFAEEHFSIEQTTARLSNLYQELYRAKHPEDISIAVSR